MFGRRAPRVLDLGAEREARRPRDPAASATLPATAGEARTAPADEATPAPDAVEGDHDRRMNAVLKRAHPDVTQMISPAEAVTMPRAELARRIAEIVDRAVADAEVTLEAHRRRDVVTALVNEVLLDARRREMPGASAASRDSVDEAKRRIQPILMERIDAGTATTLPRNELARQVSDIVAEIVAEQKMQINQAEQRDLVTMLLNDMLGLGPLEPLLADETVTDILVNGSGRVYVERAGKLRLTPVTFRDDAHVMNIATRIVSRIGRRIDESTPLVDARLADGSRVNIIVPPLAIDGPSISIRKFARQKITLEAMERQKNLSPQMATALRIASACRINILISGGTGSGKTTLLNAMSRTIDDGERIVTIEDAAELQLQQPHVVRLETRPTNLEGQGEITQRDLVRNALRMRPDRIILGEIRGGEALDMLQAMNTGHDGSLCTIHANRPREALTRLENMVAMAGVRLPHEAVRAQIVSAVNMIVQVARMRDGIRRVTHITEVVGMEADVVTTQDLFTFHYESEDADGRLVGTFVATGLRPHFLPRARYYGLERALVEAVA